MKGRVASSRLRVVGLAALVVLAAVLRTSGVNPAMAQTQQIGAWRVSDEPPMDGSSPEWQSIIPVFVPTTPQQATPPMGGGSVQRVAVRAVHWENRLYVMLEWFDPTPDLTSDRYEAFTDAAAIQFPARAGVEVPAVCMGQADQAVNIWEWRSDRQEPVPTLPEGAYVDFYPETDDLYFPARAAGNPLSTTDRSAVLNLVAGGFGTLTATDRGSLQGHGVYRDGRWMVVFSRPFEPTGSLQPTFDADETVDVAFAVWDGSRGERDGMKSVTAFTQLAVTPEKPPRRAVAATGEWPAYTPPNPFLGIGVGVAAALLVAAIVALARMRRRWRELDAGEG